MVRNEEAAWIAKPENGQKATIDIVRQTMAKNTPLLTRLCFEGTGKLTDQVCRVKKEKYDRYIPQKTTDSKMKDVIKYGGFGSVKIAYFILVEHDLKKKRIRTLESIPIYWKERIEKDPLQLEGYCKNVLGLVNPDIRVRKILKWSLVKKDGYFMYLAGKTDNRIGVCNAVQLCLQQEWINYIKKLEKETEDDAVTKEKNCELYDILCEKHNRGIYTRRPNPVGEKLKKRKERFYKLDLGEQKKVILELLNLSKIGVVQANLTLIGETSAAGTMKISKNISEFEEFKLINQSATGLYEKQVDLLTV